MAKEIIKNLSTTTKEIIIGQSTNFTKKLFSEDDSFGSAILEKYCYEPEYNLHCLIEELRETIQNLYPEISIDKSELRKVLGNEFDSDIIFKLNNLSKLEAILIKKLTNKPVI
jgi:hypothetical protein